MILGSATVVTPSVIIVVAGAAFLIGLAKGGFSGIGPLVTVLVANAMPISVAIGALLPLLMIGDIFAVAVHRGKWDRRHLVRLMPGLVLGVIVGSFFLQSISETMFKVALAGATLLFVVFRVVEKRLLSHLWTPKAWHGWLAGVTAGVGSTVAHVGGPPVSMYLLSERVKPQSYAATSAALFFVVNWLKVPAYIRADLIDLDLLWSIAPTALLIPPGIWVGRWIVVRIDQALFDRLLLVSLTAGALLLVFRG